MKITWNDVGQKTFESGVSHGVLYPRGADGVPWNGLISVEESVAGGDHSAHHFDGNKYLDLIGNEDFVASVEAFAAPREFNRCDGSQELAAGLFVTQQPREQFDFSYRTGVGNDIEGEDYGYKIHLVYNCTASPAGKSHRTRGATVEPTTRNWTFNSVPPGATTYKPTAHFELDSTAMNSVTLEMIEDILYGTWNTQPRMPTIEEVLSIFLRGLPIRIVQTEPNVWQLYSVDPERGNAIVQQDVAPDNIEGDFLWLQSVSFDTYVIPRVANTEG